MNKNIIVCSDGTGNKGGYGADSNVFKLFQYLDMNPTHQQKAFYDHGVGTSSNPIKRVLGEAMGIGFKQNVLDGYEFLCRHYQTGDKIFLFGFSRGAATVRALAYMVQTCGLIDYNQIAHPVNNQKPNAPSSNAQQQSAATFNKLLHDAWDIYQDFQDHPNCCQTKDWCNQKHIIPFHMDDEENKIYFLGIWDTVSALGFPEKMGQGMGLIFDSLNDFFKKIKWTRHKYQANQAIKYVYHALALDDNRVAFLPKIWRETNEADSPSTYPQVEQVWFAGAHSNVGGGYPRSGLSNIALHWMMVWAKEKGLQFKDDALEEVYANANVNDRLYNPRDGLSMLFRYTTRNIEELCHGPGSRKKDPKIKCGNVKIHESVLQRMADDTKRDSNDQYGYAPSFLPCTFQIVKQNSASTLPLTVKEGKDLSNNDEWHNKRNLLLAIEEKRKLLFFFFGWFFGFLGLLAWSFWQNPPMDFNPNPPNEPTSIHHVADFLQYFVPDILDDVIRYGIVNHLWIVIVLFIGITGWLNKHYSTQAGKISIEIRDLFLKQPPIPQPKQPTPSPNLQTKDWKSAGILRTLSGWIFFAVAMILIAGNISFALNIHKPFPCTHCMAITQVEKTPYSVSVYPKEYWNRSGFYLEAGARYQIELNPNDTWVDKTKIADAWGWREWDESNPLLHLGSRLWARAPDQPLFRLMGAVDASCQKGKKCPVQFSIPAADCNHQDCKKASQILVAPASGELLTFANDWPFMYYNNGNAPITFTIQRLKP